MDCFLGSVVMTDEELSVFLQGHPELTAYASFKLEEGELKYTFFGNVCEFFDVHFKDYFYLDNHPGDKFAGVVDRFYEDLYNHVVRTLPEGYRIMCSNERYFVEAVPEPTLDELKERKLDGLARWFDLASETAHVMSSLGFEIDADAVANRNIEGLITAVEGGLLAEPVLFMDYHNEAHPVVLSELKTMLLDVIANGQALYQQKWALRSAIEAATTPDELDMVVIPAVGGD